MAETVAPQSPCISLCTLDENDVCMGCFRSLDDIVDWPMLDAAGKQRVVDAAAARAAQRQKAG